MILEQYNKVSYGISKKLTNAYSTSFSLGIKAFSSEFRDPIYGIYGFVRIADEIVDTFHNTDKKHLLKKFREDTHEAIELGISTNPVLHSFQEVARKYKIEKELIESFLNSMEMDLSEVSYERDDYDNYIYGSAEVVGLMCLRVFTRGNEAEYQTLKEPARQLGAAFQKVNFLRDIQSDLEERGRIYLPGVHEEVKISDSNKKQLELEVEKEFDDALVGIKQLPIGVKLGVYSAYMYYRVLFNKIKKLSVDQLLAKRVRVPNRIKFLLLLKSIVEVKVLKVT
ncbi:MAG: phytoene/squalene synthase family protein [Melioribacteraceae bacterium]|nr:phytoene/squalene synthase family protein [Melioribacteraceae bacterium]MCF8262916.1 phytoene/squalene synthase family protein [Melioribacteraceae bacterium]MCF8411939.1 phytoene/squalene synthase family protein [Melioribacteraceae bacterium]MCF8430926.1 phytoene/squalene synthase family protein [Melioribacteraceae bacterium]